MTKFGEKNAQVLGMSVDSIFALKTWGVALGGVKHPLLADFWPHGGVAKSYGIFNEDGGFVNRALIIIDPKGVVRFSELHQGTLPDVDATLAKLTELQG
ncbi:MAG: alkyl hydroperoxide reductase subunit AhpC [Gammaproteobacteria bacterium]